MSQLLAAALALVACGKRPEAYVECRAIGPTIRAGLACTLEHRAGSSAIHACWDVTIDCANGSRGTGQRCGDVPSGGKTAVAMPYAVFGNSLDKCDTVTTMSVANTTLESR